MNSSEIVLGRKLQRLRWHDGRLQQCFIEKFEKFSQNGRLLGGGEREIWEDVPGDPPVTPSLREGADT